MAVCVPPSVGYAAPMGQGQLATRRFGDRKDAIVDVASRLLNREGAQGLRLADVAQELALDISSLSYYFPKKDNLVAACLERSILWFEGVAEEAARKPDERARAEALIAAHFTLFARQRGDDPPLALLSDLPSLADEARSPLEAHLDHAVRTIAGFFPAHPPQRSRAAQLIASNMLSSTIFWLPAWQEGYAIKSFPRVQTHLVDLFDHGFIGAAPPAAGAVHTIDDDGDDPRTRFLTAATRLINRLGHNGARVERVAAELGLSTGSFYHHLRTKTELVTACFQRSFEVFERAFDLPSPEMPMGEALLVVTRAVGHYQLTAEVPLLRIGSYQALPGELRREMFNLSNQLMHRVAGMIADGIADGSVRYCDPHIAAQFYLATVYGFSDLREWSTPADAGRLVGRLENALVRGAF